MNAKAYTVLLADSDTESARKLEKILKNEKIRIFCVTTAREILEHVRKWDINVGIIDVNLKDIEGYKIIPLVKDINKDIKIIMTTKENSPVLESKCREGGIIYYAIKPLDYNEILKVIKIAIKKDSNIFIERD